MEGTDYPGMTSGRSNFYFILNEIFYSCACKLLKRPMVGLGCGIQSALSFGNMIMNPKSERKINSFKSLLELTTGLITDLWPLPGYFIQGLDIWWWNHKACPWKGFNHPTECLKFPVFRITIGLQGQSLTTPHHFLWWKRECESIDMKDSLGLIV